MAAVQQDQLEEDGRPFESEMFHSYQLGESEYEGPEEIVPGGGFFTVDSDFQEHLDHDDLVVDPLAMSNGRYAAGQDDAVVVLSGDGENFGDHFGIDFQDYDNFLDNEEPMTIGVGLPFFQQAESADIIFEEPTKPAKLVGKYLIGADLGEGSYGKVKDALDTENLVRRAVKILRQKRLRKIPNGEQNVLREIALHRQLQHPNVVRLNDVLRVSSTSTPSGTEKVLANVASSPTNLLDPSMAANRVDNNVNIAPSFKIGATSFGTVSGSDEKIYVVMEYCATGIQQVIDAAPNRRLPESQAHRYFQQVLEGLHYLHSKGIIHKDIKPGNLLLGNDGNVKICDFGVAEKLPPFAENDLIEGSQGSPIVQPPEVANGDSPFHGFKLDVWSAGVTLYSMLAGCFPFEGDNIYQVFKAVTKGDYEVPTDFDSGLQQLIRGMLAYSAEERLSLDEVCLHDWVRRRHPINVANVSLARWNRPSTVLASLEKHGCPPIDIFLPGAVLTTTVSAPQSPQPDGSDLVIPRLSLPPNAEVVHINPSVESASKDDTLLNGTISPTVLPPLTPAPESTVRRSTRRSTRMAARRGPGRRFFRRVADQCSLS